MTFYPWQYPEPHPSTISDYRQRLLDARRLRRLTEILHQVAAFFKWPAIFLASVAFAIAFLYFMYR